MTTSSYIKSKVNKKKKKMETVEQISLRMNK